MWILMKNKLKTLLTIAGSDPMGGAGIQADIRVGISMGFHIVSAITAVTSQNSRKLESLGVCNPHILKAQLDCISEDLIPDGIKIGIVGSVENAIVISEYIKNLDKAIPIVVDPVLSVSAAGESFENHFDLIDSYKNWIFPYATVITPNLQEWENINELKLNCAVVVKGGHSLNDEIEDLLITPKDNYKISHSRIQCLNLHGTGCVFSSFLACYLALGYDIPESFKLTSDKMNKIIRRSIDYSLGNSLNGPLNINEYKYECFHK